MVREGDEELITLEYAYEPSPWFARWLGFKPRTWTEHYIGDCTVWFTYPEYEPCDTATETKLNAIWARENYKRRKGIVR
jgi:hypothetical protein